MPTNKPTRKEYNAKVIQLLEDHGPRIYPCKKCGWPVVDGYICETCGDHNPYEPVKECDYDNNK